MNLERPLKLNFGESYPYNHESDIINKKYIIISTYPENGSKNVGDKLITASLINLIKKINPYAECKVIWRALKWKNVENEIRNANAVITAGLAVCKDMNEVEYPYLRNILELNIPLVVISAGTSLPVDKGDDLVDFISDKTLSLLKEINDKAVFCTSRGRLTQFLLKKYHLDNFIFSGDVAFFDERFQHRKFSRLKKVKKIGVSEPHGFNSYKDTLKYLVDSLNNLFSFPEILMIQHGIRHKIEVEKFSQDNNLIYCPIYGKEVMLDVYDGIDIHIGFRVHGHVSALSRRKVSYLFEQDGRGVDYGINFDQKVSVPCYLTKMNEQTVDKKDNGLRYGKKSVDIMLALIERDREESFAKFIGMEKNIADTTVFLENELGKII